MSGMYRLEFQSKARLSRFPTFFGLDFKKESENSRKFTFRQATKKTKSTWKVIRCQLSAWHWFVTTAWCRRRMPRSSVLFASRRRSSTSPTSSIRWVQIVFCRFSFILCKFSLDSITSFSEDFPFVYGPLPTLIVVIVWEMEKFLDFFLPLSSSVFRASRETFASRKIRSSTRHQFMDSWRDWFKGMSCWASR